MRLALIHMDETSHRFVWSFHHALLDGWSTQLINQEVSALYEAQCSGQTLELPRSRPYRDYIAWLQTKDLARAETYWRDHLRGFSSPTPLAVRRPLARPDETSEPCGEHRHIFQTRSLPRWSASSGAGRSR